jgi:cytochrome c553
VCAACHGADGNSAIRGNPKLAQQHPEYLVKQLQEFKSGKRNNAIMQGFASMLTDEDMKKHRLLVAGFQASQGRFRQGQRPGRLGERIYRGGIADRNIAACAGCHSPNGAGIPRNTRACRASMRLHRGQLVAFRDGVRANSRK